jgi:hypothetical protein
MELSQSRLVRETVDQARAERMPSGIVIAFGALTIVAAAALAGVIPASDNDPRLAVMAGALAVYAACCHDVVAVLAVVPLAWLVQDGFLVDRFGVLVWRGWSDVDRLGLLVLAAAVGLAAGAWRRHA